MLLFNSNVCCNICFCITFVIRQKFSSVFFNTTSCRIIIYYLKRKFYTQIWCKLSLSVEWRHSHLHRGERGSNSCCVQGDSNDYFKCYFSGYHKVFQSQRRLKGSRTEICITVKTVSCLKHNHRHRNIYIIHAVPCTKYSTSGCLSPPGGEPVIPSLVLDLSLLTCELNLWLCSCWIHYNARGQFLPK